MQGFENLGVEYVEMPFPADPERCSMAVDCSGGLEPNAPHPLKLCQVHGSFAHE